MDNPIIDSSGTTLTERLGSARLQSRDISELIGLCKGALADGVVNIQEALFILQWLEDHRSVTPMWPADVLYETLDRLLEDGRLESDEESELVGLLAEITGAPVKVSMTRTSPDGETVQEVERTLQTPTTLPLHEPEDGLIFEGMNYVLTGNFSYGTRAECQKEVSARGGTAQKGVTKSTNYLVIGSVGSECWAHSSFGRKIEKAIYMRQEGHDIYIVSEETWQRDL